MSFRCSNDSDYNIVTDTEVAIVLSRLSPDVIIDVIEEVISNKFRSYQKGLPNLIVSYENAFSAIKAQYPDYSQDTMTARTELYNDIINMLCSKHNLNWIVTNENTDLYSTAFFLYDFLVSNFNNIIINFFVKFITREKESLCNLLSTIDNDITKRSNKDFSNMYSKKIYKNVNSKMALLHANMDIIVDNILTFDITLYDIINETYCDPNVVKFMSSIIEDRGNYFRDIIAPYVQLYKPIVITDIRLAMQGMLDVNVKSILDQ